MTKKKQPVIFMSAPQEMRRKCFIRPSRVLGSSLGKIFHKIFLLSKGRVKLSLSPSKPTKQGRRYGGHTQGSEGLFHVWEKRKDKWEGIKEKG
jgi:hypothetical protein